jgi:predicted protein tyrosine phosphatase
MSDSGTIDNSTTNQLFEQHDTIAPSDSHSHSHCHSQSTSCEEDKTTVTLKTTSAHNNGVAVIGAAAAAAADNDDDDNDDDDDDLLPMRAPANLIVPFRVWLGDMFAARDAKFLKESNITHIVTVTANIRQFFPEKYDYYQIPAYDDPSFFIAEHFEGAIAFMTKALAESDEKSCIFVHCAAGVSRSATIVIAYLMYTEKMRYLEARKYVEQFRSIVPNSGFVQSLKLFELQLSDKGWYIGGSESDTESADQPNHGQPQPKSNQDTTMQQS